MPSDGLSSAVFDEATVAAVLQHMNGAHTEDNLVIARGLGRVAAATASRMTDIGPAGAEWTATTPDGDVQVVVPWARPVVERADIRLEVVRMFDESLAELGQPPRDAAEH